MGVDIDQNDGDWLLVHKVSSDGIVAKWNGAHPLQQVKGGSKILEVNGIRNDIPKMVSLCQSAEVLDLVVWPAPPEQLSTGVFTGGFCNCNRLCSIQDGLAVLPS